jgi:hypothetical protein
LETAASLLIFFDGLIPKSMFETDADCVFTNISAGVYGLDSRSLTSTSMRPGLKLAHHFSQCSSGCGWARLGFLPRVNCPSARQPFTPAHKLSKPTPLSQRRCRGCGKSVFNRTFGSHSRCRKWAESGLRGVASGRIGVRDIAVVPLRACSSLQRPGRT